MAEFKKTLFEEIKARAEELTELKTVKLFNNQRNNEAVEIPYSLPALMIELRSFRYSDYTLGSQRVDFEIALHLEYESYETEDIDVLVLQDLVNKKFHRWDPTNCTELMRRSEEMDHNHGNVQAFITVYEGYGVDNSVAEDQAEGTHQVNTLEITGDAVDASDL